MANLYRKTPKVVEKNGTTILSVQRHIDGEILSVGMKTKSGGKIISIEKNNCFVGNIRAEIGRKGAWTAIAAIVI